jgi:hypothetical protein
VVTQDKDWLQGFNPRIHCKDFLGPRSSRTRIQNEDPVRGSVTKIFSGPAAQGRVPRTQTEDPARGFVTKIFSGPAARGRIPRAQAEDPVRGSITKIFSGPRGPGQTPDPEERISGLTRDSEVWDEDTGRGPTTRIHTEDP